MITVHCSHRHTVLKQIHVSVKTTDYFRVFQLLFKGCFGKGLSWYPAMNATVMKRCNLIENSSLCVCYRHITVIKVVLVKLCQNIVGVRFFLRHSVYKYILKNATLMPCSPIGNCISKPEEGFVDTPHRFSDSVLRMPRGV